MKKILFVSFVLEIGGAQLLLKDLAAHFINEGFDCRVWGPCIGNLIPELEQLNIPFYVKDFKVDSINRDKSINFDIKTQKHIEKLINKCKKDKSKLAIRCAGTITEKLFESFDFSGVKIVGIFDTNSALIGKTIKGYPVYSSDLIKDFCIDKILVAHLKPKFLIKNLKALGYKNLLSVFPSSKLQQIKDFMLYLVDLFDPIKFFTKINPDLVFVNNANNFWAVIVAKLLGKKVIWGIHEGFSPETFRVYPHFLFLMSFKLADKFIFPSYATYEYYKKYVPEYKANIIYNGVKVEELEKFKAADDIQKTREELNIPQNHKIIINVSIFNIIKGLEYFVKAGINTLNSYENKNLTFILVGENNTDYSKLICELVEKSGYANNFRIIPATKDVFKYFNLADIYVTSSISETFCISNIEAGIFKKPVISTNVCGIPEVITHNETGLLFPNENMEYHIEKNIKYLLDNPQEMDRLAQNAYNKYFENFTFEKTLKEYNSVIDSVLSS